MMKLVVVVLLVFAGIVLAQDEEPENTNKCVWGGSPHEWKDDSMSECCWYSEETCCTPAVMEIMEPLLNQIYGVVYNQLTDQGENTNQTVKECFTYVENFLCFLCHPNTNSFVKMNDSLEVTVCEDFCDDFYDSCAVDSLPGVQNYFEKKGITSGTQLCLNIPKLLKPILTPEEPSSSPSPAPEEPSSSPVPEEPSSPSPVPEEPSSSSSPSPVPEEPSPSPSPSPPAPAPAPAPVDPVDPVDPDETTTPENPNRKAMALPEIVVIVSSGDSSCFEGVPPSDVGKSNCTIWDPSEYSSDSFWWYWVFFVLAAIVIIAILIVIAVVAGVIVYKKRFAATVVTSSNTGDYPNLDELEE